MNNKMKKISLLAVCMLFLFAFTYVAFAAWLHNNDEKEMGFQLGNVQIETFEIDAVASVGNVSSGVLVPYDQPDGSLGVGGVRHLKIEVDVIANINYKLEINIYGEDALESGSNFWILAESVTPPAEDGPRTSFNLSAINGTDKVAVGVSSWDGLSTHEFDTLLAEEIPGLGNVTASTVTTAFYIILESDDILDMQKEFDFIIRVSAA